VAVEMRIYEGDVATIKEIRFVGNHAFTEKQLRAQMFHKTKNLFSWFDKSDHYSKEKLNADLEMLKSFYMDRGYLNFKIESTQVSLSVDKKFVYFTISISEGQQYFFKNISLGGDMVVDRAQLQTIIDEKIKPGAVFSRKAIWETKEALEERLGQDGYSKADVRLVDDIDQNKRLVNMKFYIDAHKRITVRRIIFTGNTLTQDKVLRRELEQFEGSWISTTKVKEGKEAIMRSGYASNVDIETVPVLDKDDQVDLVHKVEEQRTAQVSAGVSYSGADRLSFNLGADLKNFVGTGKDLNFMFNHGKAVQTYSLGYSNPYFTDSGVGFAYNIYRQKTRLSRTSNVFDFALDSTGISAAWQFRISKYNYFKLGGGYDHTILKMIYNTAPIEAKKFVNAYDGRMSFKEAFVNFGWGHNSLDTYMFPTRGLTNNLDFKVSVPVANLRLYKIDYDISWFKPIYKPFVLNLKLDMGYSDSFNNKPFPFYKHYYLGGGDSVRGYEERSLGPKSSDGRPFGGNAMIMGRAQIIFPPPFFQDAKNVRTSLFLDGGQVYDTHNKKDARGNERNPTGIRYSAGLGLSFNVPALNIPVAVSIAWPLNLKYGDTKRRFTFSMGTQF
jgi:outer membrane protein insertion porin family